MPVAVGLAGVLGAATTRAAGDDTTDRAQLHRWHRPLVVPQLALMTLEHTPVDIQDQLSNHAKLLKKLVLL